MESVRHSEWNASIKKIFLLYIDGRLLNHVFVRRRTRSYVNIITDEGGHENIHIHIVTELYAAANTAVTNILQYICVMELRLRQIVYDGVKMAVI